jgi:diadenosine tetraphosphatase ApaH/serine/threonine PP2A family protein phosphatase
MRVGRSHRFTDSTVSYGSRMSLMSGEKWILIVRPLSLSVDECQTKYGNAAVWKACCQVFDHLNLAAVSPPTSTQTLVEIGLIRDNHAADHRRTSTLCAWRSFPGYPDDRSGQGHCTNARGPTRGSVLWSVSYHPDSLNDDFPLI